MQQTVADAGFRLFPKRCVRMRVFRERTEGVTECVNVVKTKDLLKPYF